MWREKTEKESKKQRKKETEGGKEREKERRWETYIIMVYKRVEEFIIVYCSV